MKRLMEAIPGHLGSYFYYRAIRHHMLGKYQHDPSLTEAQESLQTLRREGICVVPDFLSREECQEILEELTPAIEQTVQGTYKGDHVVSPQRTYRLANASSVSARARDLFYHNQMIASLAKAYVSKNAYSLRQEVDIKVHVGRVQQADTPHFDNWRLTFKAFLYLEDVSHENAPFAFYPGTHAALPWRGRYDYEWERDGPTGRYGHFFMQEMVQLQMEHGFEEVTYVGKAGTLILADFRGIHKGTTLDAGRRVLLNNTFTV